MQSTMTLAIFGIIVWAGCTALSLGYALTMEKRATFVFLTDPETNRQSVPKTLLLFFFGFLYFIPRMCAHVAIFLIRKIAIAALAIALGVAIAVEYVSDARRATRDWFERKVGW